MTTPSPINPPRNSQRQRGAVMIIMALILMLGLITLFTFRLDRRGPELEADRKTALALAQAKEALLGNIATNSIATGIENPGRLPCPNIYNNPIVEGNSSGLSGLNCQSPGAGIPNNMGRFPWRSLRVSDLRDGASERLWYVIDPAFVDNGVAMNSVITPSLAVNGNRVVAVIIAPGPPLGALNQQRDTANQGIYTNYLESYGGPTMINLNPPSPNFNDRMITITATEVFNVVTQRMVREFVRKLEETGLDRPFYPPTYPTMARRVVITQGPPPNPPDTWFDNQWDTAVSSYSPTPLSNPTQFTLQFVNCTSVYTVIQNGASNTISGRC